MNFKFILKRFFNFKRVLKWSFLFLFSLFLSGCYLGQVNTRFNLPSVGDKYAPSDSSVFYVDLDINAYESNDEPVPYYEISTTEEYGDSALRNSPSNCEILYDDSEESYSTETLICILDVPEFEFTSRDLHMVYNIPEGMCEYIEMATPWHFNFPIREGPVSIVCPVLVSGDGDEEPEEQELYCDADLTQVCRDGENTNCPDEEKAIKPICPANKDNCYEKEEDLCPFSAGGIRCCSGGLKEDESPWEPDDHCFGGPGTHVVQSELQDYKKIYTFYAPEDGFRQTISLQSLLSFSSVNENTSHANYLELLDISPDNLGNVESRLPDFLKWSEYYPRYAPRWFFDFSCLDSAGEIKHQILLMIREWNTFDEFESFYDSGGSDEGDPDVEGEEGDECPYEERWRSGSSILCNDHFDLDDYETYPRIVFGKSEDEEESE